MKITVFGAGNVGGTLGRRWARAEHTITFGVRDTSALDVQKLIDEIGGKATSKPIADAAADAEVVTLCIP